MTTYVVDFESLGTETSPTIPGKASISLPKNTVNTTSTSLALTGLGTSLYGEYQQENFIRLLEHFASKTAPPNPTVGQLWFYTAENKLKVYDMTEQWVDLNSGIYITITEPTNAVEGNLWYNPTENILYLKINPTGPYANTPRYFGGVWVQVWPHVVPYASLIEYNALAARINKVIGPLSISGTDSDAAMNRWGWAETDLLPIYTTYNTPSQFDNRAWLILISRMLKAARHVDQAFVPISNISQYGYILDGRGNNEATAEAYSPSYTWVYGWGGGGIVTQMSRYAALEASVTALENNRFSMNTLDTTWTVLDVASRPSWHSTKVYVASVQFANEAEAQRFFNTGGQLRFNIGNTGGITPLYVAWQTLFTNGGTGVNDYSTAGFVVDWKGCKLGPNGSYLGGASSKGYYDLTTSYQTLHSVNRAGAYGSGSLTFEAKTSTSGGWTVDVRITFEEDYTGAYTEPSVDGTTIVSLQVRTSTGNIGVDPTISTPPVVIPTATSSGTFLTAPAE